MRGMSTNASLAAVMDHALKHADLPDVVLVTGDLVQDDSRGGYEHFRDLMAGLGVPVYCLPGNHDVPALMAEVLDGPPFSLCGVEDHGTWSLILLDTWIAGDAGGKLAPAELRRLDDALAARPDAHVLIALHHQPVPMGSHWLDTVGLHNAAEFLDLVQQHTNVRCLLWGHVHQASDRELGGMRLLSTPSTCSQFLPGAEQFTLDTRPPACRWLELRPDGTIDTSVVWVE